MWYEIIPTFGIITAAFCVPGLAIYNLNKLVYGNPFRRDMTERWNRLMFQRDERLTGDAYVQNGLESIPDKD